MTEFGQKCKLNGYYPLQVTTVPVAFIQEKFVLNLFTKFYFIFDTVKGFDTIEINLV